MGRQTTDGEAVVEMHTSSTSSQHSSILPQHQNQTHPPHHSHPDTFSHTTTPQTYPTTLRLLTYNAWGLKYIAIHRHARLLEIGRQISLLSPPPQIVGLQECWTQRDYLAIRSATAHILPHGKFYHSGIFGGGLAILSAFPIEESNMVRYPLNGRPTAFFRGDWFVGKGVACARLRLGPGKKDVAEVFCTHLHAPYESEPNDSYICHRTAQAWEIAKLMRGAAERGHVVIGLGDFNMVPLSLAHRIIEARAPVRDVWRVVHPESSIGAFENPQEKARGVACPSVRYNLEKNGTTCDSALNTWRWEKQAQKMLDKGVTKEVELDTPDAKAKRLDYIFFGSGEGEGARRWRVDEVKMGMTMRHPELLCSLSDHFSVEAVVSCEPSTTEDEYSSTTSIPATSSSTDTFPTSTQTQHTNTTPKQPPTTITPQTTHLSPDIFTQITTMIHSYFARERRQRRLRLTHFLSQVTISIGCFIAIWWSPRNYVSFILILLSTLGLSAGVIDGLIGGLFVSSEIRALKEFEWEIENARAIALAERADGGVKGSEQSWTGGLMEMVEAERGDIDGEEIGS